MHKGIVPDVNTGDPKGIANPYVPATIFIDGIHRVCMVWRNAFSQIADGVRDNLKGTAYRALPGVPSFFGGDTSAATSSRILMASGCRDDTISRTRAGLVRIY